MKAVCATKQKGTQWKSLFNGSITPTDFFPVETGRGCKMFTEYDVLKWPPGVSAQSVPVFWLCSS